MMDVVLEAMGDTDRHGGKQLLHTIHAQRGPGVSRPRDVPFCPPSTPEAVPTRQLTGLASSVSQFRPPSSRTRCHAAS